MCFSYKLLLEKTLTKLEATELTAAGVKQILPMPEYKIELPNEELIKCWIQQ